ncbi:hypothetical protein [Noviherbaspirillum pedocola]|uniref:Lipoprotein n=1 Tax=Noviherbaspirillum pedocola TaxID=2801341 RepID=A0A934T1P1_9BURK|nr:hypothetical protein [Noviherbaspirillum pedocola]MBK4739206.1 hypothetical protein [Noviherbaspirillum pedocola]
MRKIIVLSIFFALVGCSDESEKHVNATPEMVAAANPGPAANYVPPVYTPPPKPSHLYSMEEDGEYGYEPGISENDEKSGTKAQALIMVRYLGESNGVHSVQVGDANVRQVTSCKLPCEFVKNKTYVAGTLVKTETMRAAEGSIVWAVMQDIQNGELKPYGKHKG